MRKIILFLSIISFGTSQAQIFNPVKWETSVEKISDKEYKLISKATIEKGWHLYSQNVPEGGPIPTTFSYSEGDYKTIGNTKEEDGHTVDDPVFEMRITYFEDSAIFEQTVEVDGTLNEIIGSVEFMACDDVRCTPPNDVELVFNLSEDINKASEKKKKINSQGLLEPVKWSFNHRKITEQEYELVFTANIDKNWAIYSQTIDEGGPIPTEITFKKNDDYQLIGKTQESDKNKISKKEPLFDNVVVGKFFNQAIFT